MKTLANNLDKTEILTRLDKLSINAPRQWGKMNINQMLCHLSDSFDAIMGNKKFTPADNIFTRTFVKWLALKVPIAWPKGIQTRPELDQEKGGTKPHEFNQDRDRLKELTEKFSNTKDTSNWQHPIFGKMSSEEWQRWGYLHMDHHFRQFNS